MCYFGAQHGAELRRLVERVIGTHLASTARQVSLGRPVWLPTDSSLMFISITALGSSHNVLLSQLVLLLCVFAISLALSLQPVVMKSFSLKFQSSL